MRKTNIMLTLFGLLALLFVLTFVDAKRGFKAASSALENKRLIVSELGLSDLALFTEARYTRHLSQTDLHSAFQDHPMAMEHFPSGSLVTPPPHLFH